MATQLSKPIETRASDVISQGMDLVDLFINKNYLIEVDKCDPIPLDPSLKTNAYMSLFQIDKIVYDPNENINDKLVSVYSALSNFGSSVLLLLVADKKSVNFYLGTRDTNQPYVSKEILKKSLHGNFPGINIVEKDQFFIESLMEKQIPSEYSSMAVTSVSIVPSTRDDDKENFVQGIEKFIDSMAGEEYTAVFVSKPLTKEDMETKKRGLEEMYSALSQCAQVSLTYGENESDSIAEGISTSFSKAVNDGISDTSGSNSGVNRSKSRNRGSGFNFGLFGTGFSNNGGSSTSRGTYSGTFDNHTDTHGETTTDTSGTSSTNTNTKGSSLNLQINQENKSVKVLLEKIDEQLQRIRECESYGLWDSACYFISPNQESSMVAANTFKALVAGESTGVENSFINTWSNDYECVDTSLAIMDYLRYGMHPRFSYKPKYIESGYDDQEITVASLISGVELPVLMSFPRKSVNGVTSITSAEFGRNVFTKEKKTGRQLPLGAIYHMGEVFEKNRVDLDVDSLTSHCFVTGSTGSGKSNTTYQLIQQLIKPENNVKFLVVEPAKGEYKKAFAKLPNVNIFTTNPNYFSMLGINPFEFNEEIHVLEHLDRLIEIFSACWPLYAAMPAVLKTSFERAYIKHGWDLNHSTNIDMRNGKFPNFNDIVEILPVVMDESQFSAETKGNYVGSLSTRVESLTNGIIGQIFNNYSVPDSVLFDENTIIDLSRVGSTETKALIMGIIVLKLSEYRQSTATETNSGLKHITILEEAHNLLKRTSTEQGQESSNVQGKSVEMISNSIAEMRTYGEGFVIVDQSPTAVDISAIKNTNTKILMRLPEASDCEAVGRSIGLKEEQILELSKLDKGVAAVFQNGWLESVLVKIDKASDKYESNSIVKNDLSSRIPFIGEVLEELRNEVINDKKLNPIWLKGNIGMYNLDKSYTENISRIIDKYSDQYNQHINKSYITIDNMIVELLNCIDLLKMYESILPKTLVTKKEQLTSSVKNEFRDWCTRFSRTLEKYIDFDNNSELIKFVVTHLISYQIENSVKGEYYKAIHYVAKNMNF